MSTHERIKKVEAYASALIHAFRDKFDFSEENHYEKVVEHAWKAAEALVKKGEDEIAKLEVKK